MYVSVNYVDRFLQGMSALLGATMWLFERCTSSWKFSFEHSVNALVGAASLVLTVLQYLKQDRLQMFAEIFPKILSAVQNWIKDPRVIGGSMFGNELSEGYYSSSVFFQGDAEIRVCCDNLIVTQNSTKFFAL